MNRLARAQDRKFEGSQGYALARRLWLAEEELRLARSTISALGAEVNKPVIRHAPTVFWILQSSPTKRLFAQGCLRAPGGTQTNNFGDPSKGAKHDVVQEGGRRGRAFIRLL